MTRRGLFNQPFERKMLILRQDIQRCIDLGGAILPSHSPIYELLIQAQLKLEDEMKFKGIRQEPEPAGAA